jgi:outer membrane protein OmpA-like peptidoglycan-associated protein
VSLLPADSQSAATSEPMPAAAPAPAPSGLQTASLTIEGVEDMTFLFDVDSAELSDAVQIELRSLADTLHTNEEWIQVLGFASGDTATTDQARKLALSRALKVRSFLIDAGIASARIQVRSLGDRAEGGPANRVDIKPIGS